MNNNMLNIISIFLTSLIFLFMFPATSQSQEQSSLLAPLPDRIPSPDNNPTTPEKVDLGKQLFFDKRLSGNNDMSCATCHDPQKGFADGMALGKGFEGKTLKRHTPTVLNVGWYSTFFWDGRAGSLEEQALGPIQAPDEMNQDMNQLVEELRKDKSYVKQFQNVFGQPINNDTITKTLAAYQRTLVTRNSPFDRYLKGDEDALSSRAKEGMALFMGRADCIRCHNGPLLSDGKYYRIGIGFTDKGRGNITGKKEDWYKFRTPALRNVAQTAPYMHNGSERTLFDAVEFYFRRVPSQSPEGLELDIEPLLSQSYSDISAIVEFLKSLSGQYEELEGSDL